MIQFTIAAAPGVRFASIENFPLYAVGDDGSVWSQKSLNGVGVGEWHQLTGHIGKGDYMRVGMSVNHKTHNKSVHRLVLEAFTGPAPSDDMETRHLDGNRANNRATNLAWGTALENAIDREGHGNTLRHEAHGRALLTAEQVRTIRRTDFSTTTRVEVARLYGVSTSAIKNILNGKNWKRIS